MLKMEKEEFKSIKKGAKYQHFAARSWKCDNGHKKGNVVIITTE